MPILLITATVTPPPAAIKLGRIDPKARLADYEDALGFYLERLADKVFDAIVFVENSATDVESLKALAGRSGHGDRVEFISFYGLDYPSEYGRAYGEMRLIDHAMAVSTKIRAAAPGEMIWKVTGRYVVLNVGALVRVRAGAVLCCHCRDFPKRWADMYLMGWAKGAYESVLGGAADRIRESHDRPVSSELEFRRLVDERAAQGNVVRRFAEAPQVRGVRGFDNKKYEEERFKSLARVVLAKVAPWIWI